MGQLSDEEAIRRLILRYPATIDNADIDGLARLFARARLHMGAGSILEGEDDIRRFFADSLKTYAGGQTLVRHHVTNIVVDVDVDDDGRHGSATSYYVTFQQVPDLLPLQPIISGGYEDAFEKDDSGWWFASRRFQPLLRGNIGFHVTPVSGWDTGGSGDGPPAGGDGGVG